MAKTAVFGIFPTRTSAETCITALLNNGFTNNDVSVLAADKTTTQDLSVQQNNKAPEGASTGGVAGGAIGGAVGLLAGIGMLAIPGVGPLIAAGPIMAALAGVGAGAVAGSLVGALVGMGIPEYEAKRYEGHVRDGGTLVSAHCETSVQVDRAKDVLKQCGAKDIASADEASAPMKQAS